MPGDIRVLIGLGFAVGAGLSAWELQQRRAKRVATATAAHTPLPGFDVSALEGKTLRQVAILHPFWPRSLVGTTVTPTRAARAGVEYELTSRWFSWGPQLRFRGVCDDLSALESPLWLTLAAEDGSWIVVTDGDARSRCWVLSTSGALPADALATIRDQLAKRGFDSSPGSLRAEPLPLQLPALTDSPADATMR